MKPINPIKPKQCGCGRTHTQMTNVKGIQWMDEEAGIGLYVWDCECKSTLATPINEQSERWLEEGKEVA